MTSHFFVCIVFICKQKTAYEMRMSDCSSDVCSSDLVNEQRKRAMGRKVLAAIEGPVRGRTVALLGLTFKPNTDDMRDAPSIAIIQALQDAGAKVRAYDPEGMEAARAVLSDVEYAASAYAAAEGAAATVIVTEWDAFRALDLTRLKAAMADPLLVDLRNIYRPAQAEAAGLRYVGIGRPGEPVEDTELAGERRAA